MNVVRDPLDVVIGLTYRLGLAVATLKSVSSACTLCAGAGKLRERWEMHLLTDDERIERRMNRWHILQAGSYVLPHVVTAGYLWTPCPVCGPLRKTVKICEGRT